MPQKVTRNLNFCTSQKTSVNSPAALFFLLFGAPPALAPYTSNQASPDMMSADQKAISRGITVLSNSQSYVKSFDGMAYELKGKIKDGGSTADIDTVSGDGGGGVGEERETRKKKEGGGGRGK